MTTYRNENARTRHGQQSNRQRQEIAELRAAISCASLQTLSRMRLRSIQLAIIAILLAGCSSGVPVSVSNQSSIPLKDVVLSGSGFTTSIGTVAPGASVATYIQPRGESAIAIAFTANTQRVVLPEQGYIEGSGNYSATVTVERDLTATVTVQLGWY